MDNVDLALLNIGGTGESVCQARSVVIETTKAVPIQVDGEPLLVNPFRLKIEYNNSAWMLTKKRTSCKLQNNFNSNKTLLSRPLPRPGGRGVGRQEDPVKL